MYEVVVSAGRRQAGRAVMRDVIGMYVRRPARIREGISLGHSADLRVIVYLLVGAEVLVEGLMDVSLIPPAWRFVHLLWIALMVDAAIAFGAVTRRHPHQVSAETLTVRAGLLDEFTLPLDLVGSVRRERLSIKGRGVRPVPDRPEAVACNVSGTAELVVELREPVSLRLASGARLVVRRLHLAADDPAAAHRALRSALA
ncbi:hypothetical protein SAMN05414137_10734 [Streptacidiphilus jiangxiensis]|uniref:PH domain-containing protein n=1 Tax=Streptacidiphilus jiangxiensis TaxID=235985 RepID=A0A1H7NS72_STRJI|nr:hypothetical protein SAMN05414137_10734 [Streptacidiphilus jiangxiensis]